MITEFYIFTCVIFIIFDTYSQAFTCYTDEDCSLSGICQSNGICHCDKMWIGLRCNQLNLDEQSFQKLYPLDSHDGSSWDASIIYNTHDHSYHMFVSQIVNNCGILSWETNSRIIHTVSHTSPTGPYFNYKVVFPTFSHNPNIIQYKNTYLLYFIGKYPVTPLVNTDCKQVTKIKIIYNSLFVISGILILITCIYYNLITITFAIVCFSIAMYLIDSKIDNNNINIDRYETSRYQDISSPYLASIHVATSKSLYGPWTIYPNISYRHDNWNYYITNPCPLVLNNDTVILAYRGNPKKPFWNQHLGLLKMTSNITNYTEVALYRNIVDISYIDQCKINNEDPYIWQDKNGNHNYHMLFHDDTIWQQFGIGSNYVGGIAYSRDLHDWRYSLESVAYTTIINSTLQVVRRERPFILWTSHCLQETDVIGGYLITAVTNSIWTDTSYTSIQAIKC
jgi:hypothetical protein